MHILGGISMPAPPLLQYATEHPAWAQVLAVRLRLRRPPRDVISSVASRRYSLTEGGTMHQPQACPTWLLIGLLLLVGLALTMGTLAAQSTPDKTFTNSIGIEFVLIPPGTFKMGSDRGDPDERPVHDVT